MLLTRQDVLLAAPTAEFFVSGNPTRRELEAALEPPSPEEIIQAQDVEIRRLRTELERTRVTANTIANTAACLSYLAQRPDSEWVTVPNDVRDKMKNVKLSVKATEEGTQIRWVTRPRDHVFEGRADG